MKNKLSLLLILLSLTFLSFKTNPHKPEKINLKTGTYSGCTNCPNSVELSINEDSTFHYVNKSDPGKPIDVKGNWEMAKNNSNTIVLKNYKSARAIPNKWKIDPKYPCIKSKMTGLEIIRLCNENSK